MFKTLREKLPKKIENYYVASIVQSALSNRGEQGYRILKYTDDKWQLLIDIEGYKECKITEGTKRYVKSNIKYHQEMVQMCRQDLRFREILNIEKIINKQLKNLNGEIHRNASNNLEYTHCLKCKNF